jgi:hypothetical protein
LISRRRLAVAAAYAGRVVVVVAVVELALAALAVAAPEVDGSGELVVGVGDGDGEADGVPAGVAGGTLSGVEQGATMAGALVPGGHLQVGQLGAAQRPLGGMLREDQEHPAGSSPPDQVTKYVPSTV